jgi:hypothetical protein
VLLPFYSGTDSATCYAQAAKNKKAAKKWVCPINLIMLFIQRNHNGHSV